MGERGPGAKPTRPPLGETRPEPVSWDAEGLTRTERVIAFIESLTITQGKGAGGPFILRPWQLDIVHALYDRPVREALVTMGRKNGKTELAAALALCHLCGPEADARGEVYSAAADRDQASRIFRSMEAFIFRDGDLARRINIKRFEKILEVKAGVGAGSIYRALSSDATKAHGLNPSFAVCDELAQWKGRTLYDNIRTGLGARERQMILTISTKSSDAHSVMSEVTKHGRDVLAGVVEDDSFAAIIYEVPLAHDEALHAAQMTDEECWKLANPALGDFLSLDDMRKEAAQARRIPARENSFRNLKLNQEVEASEGWITPALWMACKRDIDQAALVGKLAYGGLDLGSVADLTSFSLFFPESQALLSWSWVPGDRVAERAEKDKVPYDVWARNGQIERTPGRATDKRRVALKIAELNAKYRPRLIGFDKWGMPELLRIMDEEGIALPLVECRQGYATMSPAMKAFEERVLNQALVHDGNPVLGWAVNNVRIAMDPAGNIKPDKDRSMERIDPAVAAIMAVGLAAGDVAPASDRAFREDDVMAIFSDAAD